MKVAMTIGNGYMAPVFAGVEVWIIDSQNSATDPVRLSTEQWHPLSWGGELQRWEVEVLLCGGIDMATYSAVEGHGIKIIPDLTGEPLQVFDNWISGRLKPPEIWPPNPSGYLGFGRGRGRGRGKGRGRRGYGGGNNNKRRY